MILNGNQRGGAKELAMHLLKEENEHVEVHQLRGFVSQNLVGALNEAYAISKETKCRRFVYSLSLNPPPNEWVSIADFEKALEQAEQRLGLTGQPRAIVFHEKEQRRHCHVVWSRIDIQTMKAIQLSHDHPKLKTLSRELFLEHGWTLPRGLVNSQERDAKNFTLAEWQQAKRIGKDPRQIKSAIQEAWAIADSKAVFPQALQQRGYVLARGDKGRFVALDGHGEVYAIARQLDVKTKAIREKLGEADTLPSVEEAKQQIASHMLPLIQQFQAELRAKAKHHKSVAKQEMLALVEKQRAERKAFLQKLAERQQQEALARQARFRSGVMGFWDKLRGTHKRIQQENEREAALAKQRDQQEKDRLIAEQLSQRKVTLEQLKTHQQQYRENQLGLNQDKAHFEKLKNPDLATLRDQFMKTAQPSRKQGKEPDRNKPSRDWTPSR
ncbi:MAG: relaxase/mobilization nuclease domain-containing protein [Vampirovibrionales bacterium]|nr:relaxase/mobilization nuclease domain-containing protein [Vampirovibrionales bacterium]